jgi:hypothetical protein
LIDLTKPIKWMEPCTHNRNVIIRFSITANYAPVSPLPENPCQYTTLAIFPRCPARGT